MPEKPLFLVSHLGSGSEILKKAIEKATGNKFMTGIYHHPFDLPKMAEILYNHQFTGKSLYKFAKFIFLIRDPKETFKIIGKESLNYYIYRIRRIYEMSRHTENISFSLDKINISKIEKFLGIKLDLEMDFPIKDTLVNNQELRIAYKVYNKYVKLLN